MRQGEENLVWEKWKQRVWTLLSSEAEGRKRWTSDWQRADPSASRGSKRGLQTQGPCDLHNLSYVQKILIISWPRKVALVFLVRPAKQIQSLKQGTVTNLQSQGNHRANCAISLWIYEDSCFPLGSLSFWMPKCGLKISILHGHLHLWPASSVSASLMEMSINLHGVAALTSLSLWDSAAVLYKESTFPFSKPSPSVLEKCPLLRAMPPSSECLCPLLRKGLQIMSGMHFLKHTTSYYTVFLSKIAQELVNSICHSSHGGHVF